MNWDNRLYIVAIVIGIIVIVAMAAAFSLLFFAYANQRKKVLSHGVEDPELTSDLESLKARYLKRRRRAKKQGEIPPLYAVANSRTLTLLRQRELADEQAIAERERNVYTLAYQWSKHRSTGLNIVGWVVDAVVTVVALALVAFGLFSAINNEPIFFGNTTYMVIQTGSMSEANDENEYLEENHLDNQIEQYALIGVDRVDSIADIQMYDVIAFYDFDGDIIVHRVVAIREDDQTHEITLQTRGDANTGSLPDEMAIDQDRLLGRYSGFKNFGLGVTITYLKSPLGLIALCGFIIFLCAFSAADSGIDKTYDSRMVKLAGDLDSADSSK